MEYSLVDFHLMTVCPPDFFSDSAVLFFPVDQARQPPLLFRSSRALRALEICAAVVLTCRWLSVARAEYSLLLLATSRLRCISTVPQVVLTNLHISSLISNR